MTSEYDRKRTRLQEAIQKRTAEDEFNEKEEYKRQKKMFTPRNIIGPRAVLIDSNITNIKLEEDAECRSTVKQEPSENDSALLKLSNDKPAVPKLQEIKQEVDTKFFSEAEVMLEESTLTEPFMNTVYGPTSDIETPSSEAEEHKVIISATKESNRNSETFVEPNVGRVFQNHVKQLQFLIDQKEQEINTLVEMVKGLQNVLDPADDLSSDPDLENGEFILLDANMNKGNVIRRCTSDNSQIVANLTSDLMDKQAKVQILSMKLMKLQDKKLGTACHDLETSKIYKTHEDFLKEAFQLVLPFLYPDLQLNSILNTRAVCRSWRNSTDLFLKNHASKMPFKNEAHIIELRKLEEGRMPVWDESLLKKLIRKYTYSDIEMLKTFSDDRTGTIIGSTVCLDNLYLANKFNSNVKLSTFLNCYDNHITTLVIRHRLKLYNFKIQLLMDRVKLCLSKLPELQHFKLVFCIEKDKLAGKPCKETSLRIMENKALSQTWQPSDFPKLEKLESLEFDIDASEEWEDDINLFEIFCKSLIQPYSEQLKQLGICSAGIDPSNCLVFPNLVQVSLPRNQLYKAEFMCQHVEKCTITGYSPKFERNYFRTIERLFPKLICLRLKFKYNGEKFHFFERYHWYDCQVPFTKLLNVITLELENCGAVSNAMLDCFPNLRCIKLINQHIQSKSDILLAYESEHLNFWGYPRQKRPCKKTKDLTRTVLDITNLLAGGNLYQSIQFWNKFRTISVVTLEFSGQSDINVKPKLCRWTRAAYCKYWGKKNVSC